MIGSGAGSDKPTVAVVVNCFNDAHFLSEALSSVIAQTRAPDEVLVVDDGSAVPPADIVARFSVRYARQENRGLAAARNLGLSSITSEFIVFLDADDRLTPEALDAGLACFGEHPSAAMVYGGHRRVDMSWHPLEPDAFKPIGDDPYADLLHGNLIAMHATVMYRVADLREVGGFDPSLRSCEDYDLYLRLARSKGIATHPATVAEYRWHGGNMSKDAGRMLERSLAVHARYDARGASHSRRNAWLEGRHNWQRYYGDLMAAEVPARKEPPKASLLRRMAWAARRRLTGDRVWPPSVGSVDWGDLGSVRPVSLDFGFDRGLPIDRYYVEGFLARHAADVGGTVLEVGDDAYSRRFGGEAVTRQEILHIDGDNPVATIVGDLCDPNVLPDATFDCIVLTQTLHFVFDLDRAVARLHQALRPGGVLLLTVPGITPVERGRWGETWYWSFTRPSLNRLFAPVFGPDGIEVGVHGNVLAATAMLQGLAVDEVDSAMLDVFDPAYPTILTLRALRRP